MIVGVAIIQGAGLNQRLMWMNQVKWIHYITAQRNMFVLD